MSFCILVVPGSWHPKSLAQPLLDALSKTHETQFCPLVTNGILPKARAAGKDIDLQAPLPEGETWPDAYDDARAIHEQLRSLVLEQEKNVLVACHSYGGMPTTEAITGELGLKERRKAGKSGGVIGIFYIASFPLAVGNTTGVRYGRPIPGTTVHVSCFWLRSVLSSKIYERSANMLLQPSAIMTIDDPKDLLFNDVQENPDVNIDQLVSELVPQPAQVHMNPLRNAGYQNAPCAYLFCEKDTLVPPDIQESMVKDLNELAGDSKEIRCPAGHDPWLGWTNGCRDAILAFGSDALP